MSPAATSPAAVSPLAGAGAHDGSAPGTTSAPVTLRGLDLILPPYPDEPPCPGEPRYPDEPSDPDTLDAERSDDARSENLTDHEPAHAEAIGHTHATGEEPVDGSGLAAVEAPGLAAEPGPATRHRH